MAVDESAGDVEQILIRFVAEDLLYDRDEPRVGPDELLLGNLLDSVDVLNLVDFVERRFGIRIADDEVVPENFETLRVVAALIARKRGPDEAG